MDQRLEAEHAQLLLAADVVRRLEGLSGLVDYAETQYMAHTDWLHRSQWRPRTRSSRGSPATLAQRH